MLDRHIKKIKALRYQLHRKHMIGLLLGFFALIGLIFMLYWLAIGQFYETTDDAYVSGNLVQVMPQITGQVTQILTDETNLVKKGEVIVKLDQADTTIALKHAESQLALTVRQVEQLYHTIAELRTNVKLQQDNAEKAIQDYQRRQQLVVDKTISREELQHAKTAVATANDALLLAKNQLTTALALVGNTDLYHHPQVLEAMSQLRNAYLSYERTTIYAPETGYVAKRPVQVGQQVTPNTVLMVIVPLQQVWVDANFKESQIKYFRVNQPVKLVSDFYGHNLVFHGVVLGLNPGSGNAFDLLPPQNATGNWIKIVQRLPVRIAIDASELKQYPLRVGLSMTVTVDTHNRQGGSLSALKKETVIYQTQNYNDQEKKADELINQILQANAKNLKLTDMPSIGN